MIFVPIALAAVSAILFFVGLGSKRKAGDMAGTETTMAAELIDLAAAVGNEIGPGSFNKPAELKGTVECDQPLRAEMSGQACVWYRSTVAREYEETRVERDSEGRSRTVTHRGSENVSANERRVPFAVRDRSGAMAVNPEGAAIDGQKLVSRFEPGEQASSISFGGFNLSLRGLGLGSGRRTLGYKLEEWGLPLGAAVYVLGEARDEGGSLSVRKPAAKGGRFIVSVKSEEELLKSARTGMAVLWGIAGALLAGALVVGALMAFGVIGR